jgi:hypothetical protein
MDGAKKLLGNRVAAPHAVKQSRRAELRSHAGTDGGDQEGKTDGLGHENAACNRRDVAEYVLISKLEKTPKSVSERWAQQLSAVNLGGARIPVITQTNTVARKMFRFGLSTSSDSVEMPSKPI